MQKHRYLFGLTVVVSTAGLVYASTSSVPIYTDAALKDTPSTYPVPSAVSGSVMVSEDTNEGRTSDAPEHASEQVNETGEDIQVAMHNPLSSAAAEEKETPTPPKPELQTVPTVPFYSQFTDISSERWKKVGCGIASLAMLIEYYEPGTVSVDTLLQEGIDADAYLEDAGWTYAGLIGLARAYGLSGQTHDLGGTSMAAAFAQLEDTLTDGPVMVSVHYTFDPNNPIPHLVVANGIRDGKLYYNDPAEKNGGGSVSIAQFQSAWKQRYIEFRG